MTHLRDDSFLDLGRDPTSSPRSATSPGPFHPSPADRPDARYRRSFRTSAVATRRSRISRTYRACLGMGRPRNATFRQGMVRLFPSPTDGNAKRNLLQSLRIPNREFPRSSKKGFSSKRWAKNPPLVANGTSKNLGLFRLKRRQNRDWVPPEGSGIPKWDRHPRPRGSLFSLRPHSPPSGNDRQSDSFPISNILNALRAPSGYHSERAIARWIVPQVPALLPARRSLRSEAVRQRASTRSCRTIRRSPSLLISARKASFLNGSPRRSARPWGSTAARCCRQLAGDGKVPWQRTPATQPPASGGAAVPDAVVGDVTWTYKARRRSAPALQVSGSAATSAAAFAWPLRRLRSALRGERTTMAGRAAR